MYLENVKENPPKPPSPTSKPGGNGGKEPFPPSPDGKSYTPIHSAIKSQNILAIALCRHFHICVSINV